MKPEPHIHYRLDAGDILVRRREPDLAVDEYEHTCTRQVYEEVVHLLDEHHDDPARGTTSYALADAHGLPFTQVHVAMMFLADVGLIARCRRNWYAVGEIHLDAMVEFLGLPHRVYTETWIAACICDDGVASAVLCDDRDHAEYQHGRMKIGGTRRVAIMRSADGDDPAALVRSMWGVERVEVIDRRQHV